MQVPSATTTSNIFLWKRTVGDDVAIRCKAERSVFLPSLHIEQASVISIKSEFMARSVNHAVTATAARQEQKLQLPRTTDIHVSRAAAEAGEHSRHTQYE